MILLTVNLKMPHGSMHVILESQLQMNRIIVTLEDYHAVPKRNFLLSGEIYYLQFLTASIRFLRCYDNTKTLVVKNKGKEGCN